MFSDMIAHYRIFDCLGEGGMGTVYRAHDERLGREVALKVLKSSGDEQAIERFFREARAASALNHPNIVTVFDAGEAEHGHFIVMELVRGRVLRSLMLGQPVALDLVVSFARQTAEALAVAHRAGIVHHDLKPENIMVRDDGYVKLLDFGLARLTPRQPGSDSSTTVRSTGSHSIAGTIKYMSPEQASGHAIDTPSDIFSLGVVLYELVTGRHPFEAETPYGVLHAILSHRALAPTRLNPEVSGPLEALVLQMLEKDAHRRPSAVETATAFAALAARTSPSFASAPATAAHLSVGRAKPRGDLRTALERVRAGHGLMVCVAGEAGIGKTTLVEDFLTEVGADPDRFRVARGRCSERLAGTEAYLPLLDALEDLLQSDDGSVARTMKAVAPLWYSQLAPAEPASGMAVAQSGTQERLKRELVAFLEEACRARPIILFFDDLHWVDLSTVDVLAYVARHFDSLPLLVVVTYRPEELLVQKHAFLSTKRELQARNLCRDVVLEFLTRDDVAQYIGLKFERHQFPRTFVDVIYAKTEGNPLFMVDVLRYLCDQGGLNLEQDEWRLTRSVSDLDRELPESVRGMIQRKIDILSEDARRLLVAASVQGYQFDAAVVARVMGVDPAEIEEQLDTLERVHGFVRRVREQELPDGTLTLRYRFVHVLYQNSLYRTLTPARKTLLSRGIGKALEELHRDNPAAIASELAVLYEAAREFSVASDYFRIAARRAGDVFAYEEAFRHGRRALDCLLPLPDNLDRRRRELHILVTIGVAASASRGFSSPAVQEVYDRARALCLELNETEPLARILYGLVSFNIVRLQLESAEEAADRLTALARDSQAASLVVHGINGHALVNYYRGDFERALEGFRQLEACCSLEERRAIRATFGYDPVSAAHFYLAWCRWCLGYPDQAVAEALASERAALEIEHPYTLTTALNFSCGVHLWRGDWKALRVTNQRMMSIAKEGGFSYFLTAGIFHEGVCLAADGHTEPGLEAMRAGLDGLRAIEGRTSIRRFAGEYAARLAPAGRGAEGLDLLESEIAAMTSDRFWEAELFRLRGELLLTAGNRVEAERSFDRALSVARQQHARSFELRAAISLARLQHAGGESQHRLSLLSACYRSFTEGLGTADLAEAHRLLALSGAHLASPP